MDAFTGEQERQVKKLKRKLESWREIILPLHSTLTWDKKWYPGLTFGAVSFLYLILWFLDPPFLTLCASIGVILTLMDFLVPTLVANIYTTSSWTKNKEKLYEEICKSIVIHYNWFIVTCQSFYKLRETTPKMYYILLITSLSFMAWFGTTIDNLFLCYIGTLFSCSLPGLLNNEKFSMYLTQVINMLTSFTKSQEKNE